MSTIVSPPAELSVIIVAYNSNEVILPCLDSLSESNTLGKGLDVVVVDNRPQAGLKDCLHDADYTFHLQYVGSEKNVGFGGGNNLGVRYALAPYVLFLNPDTLVREDIYTPTLDRLRRDGNYVLGYSLTDPEGRRNYTYSYFPEYIYIFPLLQLLQHVSFRGIVNCVRPINRIAWPWGAAIAMEKEAFLRAGGFDEHIFLCNEEPDLMRRLPKRRVYILPEHIVHLEGHGREVSVGRYTAFLQSTDYYLRKYRVKSRWLYWKWVAMKLQVRRWMHCHVDKNYIEAFLQFRENDLNSPSSNQ